MRKQINIQYHLCHHEMDSRPFADMKAWKADLHQAFANLGWVVTYDGMCSSTHVEDTLINLESDGEALDADALQDLLTKFDIPLADYWGDGIRWMKLRMAIEYSLGYHAPESRPCANLDGWRADVRSAFAKLGWVVRYHGSASVRSSYPWQGYIYLASDGPPLDPDTIQELLTQFEIPNARVHGPN